MIDFNLPDYYINRELSWLSFNERVLEEAEDACNPLLERLKFISITASNLDEFFMIRVAGLKHQVDIGFHKPDDKSKLTPLEQLNLISARSHQLVRRLYDVLNVLILPELEQEGIRFLNYWELTDQQRIYMDEYYHHKIFPVLTPMAVDSSRPFPLLLNRSLNLAVRLVKELDDKNEVLFGVVQVPSVLPRYIQIPSQTGQPQFILLEHVIVEHIQTLFCGHRILSIYPFRITRNVDLVLEDEGDEEDLLERIEKGLKKLKMGAAVRLEIDASMSEDTKQILQEALELEDQDIYAIQGPVDLTFFGSFSRLPNYEHLRYQELTPQLCNDINDDSDLFDDIQKEDLLLHHPYDCFDPVIDFLKQASEDPNVLAIKQTLYRISGDSPIVHALTKAAENGKQVTVLVELKARFDEENNINWAKTLEEAGCHVIYGMVDLKTHSKITLVVRSENDQIRRYVHVSTGNYNDITARFYTDLGMFTAREEIGEDASRFFNHLTGYTNAPSLKQLVMAPYDLRQKVLDLIENEIQLTDRKRPGRIIAKMNSLTDKKIIQALYRASCAGVQIDLIVRGICCLRPGIPNVSENIRVISIVGRFLEHSRIYYFGNGGQDLFFLSSADWMTRNMDYRVELMIPVLQPNLKDRIQNILKILLADNVKSRILESDGTYVRAENTEGKWLDSQMYFYQHALNQQGIQVLFNR